MSVDLSNYHLTFDDEFNTFSRNIPGGTRGTWDTAFNAQDPTNVVRTLTGNGEQEVYVEPEYKGLGLSPFSDQNGVLTMTGNPAPAADVTALGGYKYTSGMITTQSTWSQEYGYFEMRAQLPAGQGSWPAFWMLPVGSGGGEVDIFEQLGNNPNVVHQTIHDPGAAGGGGQMYDTSVQSNNGFHTYGFQWTPTTMTFYVDGQQTGTRANTINQPMYLISNLALGGTWGGSVNSTTPFPLNMNIDYIRAYSNDPNIPAVGPNPPSSVESPPVAVNDSGISVIENTRLSIPAATLLANDSDPDNDVISISGVSGASNGTVAYDAVNHAVQFTPGANYIGAAGFTYTISDGRGGTASANVALNVTAPTPPPATGNDLFSANTVPAMVTDPDSNPVELGVKFQATSDGTITALRFYKGPQNTGTHIGDLWSSTGTLLASATFTNETASGWQQVSLATPVKIKAGQTYIAAYHTNTGHYSADVNYFSKPHTNGPLTAPASSTSGGNGVYTYGSADAFPTSTYNASNYYTDVVFNPAPQPVNSSLFAASDTPSTVTDGDTAAAELGVKLIPSQDGDITAIRFYKGPQNTGTHTGHLWGSDGTLLASVTFSNETASGWQQANLATPVHVTAGKTYEASYHEKNGHYSEDENYFVNAHAGTGALTAPSSAASGGNGVYAYGASRFPTASWHSSNYWVDAVFRP